MKQNNFLLTKISLAVLALTTIHGYAADSTAVTTKTLPVVDVTSSKENALDEVNSAGSRLGLSAKEIPASVESLNAETIQRRGDVSITDAVTRTTGITNISNPGNGIAYSVRGFTDNNSVAQAEDGQRLLVGAGTITYPADTWGYERIEVLRGISSIMFGNASVGGVVNAVRKQPSRESSFDARLSLGDYENYMLGVGGTGALGEAASFRIDASSIGGEGYMDRGRFNSKKVMSTIRFNPNKDLEIDFGLDHAEQKPTRYFGTPLSGTSINPSLRDENYNAGDAVLAYEDTRLRNKISWQATSNIKISNELYAFKADRHWKNIEVYALDDATQTVSRSDYLEILHRQRQMGDRLDATIDGSLFGKANRLLAGWEWTKVKFRHTNNAPFTGASTVTAHNFDPGVFNSPDPTVPAFETDTNTHALFMEDVFNLSEKIKLSAAFRKDFIKVDRDDLKGTSDFDKKYSPLSGRLGIIFNPIANLYLYGQLSRGNDPVTSVISLNLANRDFNLTKATQSEVGIKHSFWDNRAEWSLAAFRIVKKDIITRDPSTPGISRQGGQQSSRGFEFSSRIEPVKNWHWDLNATWVNAKFDSLYDSAGTSLANNKPSNVPKRTANIWTYYQMGAWEAGVGVRYVGSSWVDDANTFQLPSYSVVDANVAWQLNRHTTLRASVRNLTNKDYAVTSYGSTQALLGEPRHFDLIAEFKF